MRSRRLQITAAIASLAFALTALAWEDPLCGVREYPFDLDGVGATARFLQTARGLEILTPGPSGEKWTFEYVLGKGWYVVSSTGTTAEPIPVANRTFIPIPAAGVQVELVDNVEKGLRRLLVSPLNPPAGAPVTANGPAPIYSLNVSYKTRNGSNDLNPRDGDVTPYISTTGYFMIGSQQKGTLISLHDYIQRYDVPTTPDDVAFEPRKTWEFPPGSWDPTTGVLKPDALPTAVVSHTIAELNSENLHLVTAAAGAALRMIDPQHVGRTPSVVTYDFGANSIALVEHANSMACKAVVNQTQTAGLVETPPQTTVAPEDPSPAPAAGAADPQELPPQPQSPQ